MMFAIEEINNNHELLPNITLGFQAYDSCLVKQSLAGTFQLVTGQIKAIPNYRLRMDISLSAIIGHAASTHSLAMAHILGLLRYPQVRYGLLRLKYDKVKPQVGSWGPIIVNLS